MRGSLPVRQRCYGATMRSRLVVLLALCAALASAIGSAATAAPQKTRATLVFAFHPF